MDMWFFPFTMVALKHVVICRVSEQFSPNPSTKFHSTNVWLITWERRKAPLFSSSRPDIGPGYALEVIILVSWAVCFQPQTPELSQKPLYPSRKINVNITNSAAWQLPTIPLCQSPSAIPCNWRLSSSWRLIAGNLLYVLIDHLFRLIVHPLIFSLCTRPGLLWFDSWGRPLLEKIPLGFVRKHSSPMQAPGTLTTSAVSLLSPPESQGMLLLPTLHHLIFNILSSRSALKALLLGCDLNSSLNSSSILSFRNLSFFLILPYPCQFSLLDQIQNLNTPQSFKWPTLTHLWWAVWCVPAEIHMLKP